MENDLIKKADLVIVTAPALYNSKKTLAKKIVLIPNAAEIEHFAKTALAETPIAPELRNLSHPVIGFLGSVAYWIDIGLIKYLAVNRPDWSIILIGPVSTNVKQISGLPNVYLVGRKPYARLPEYMKAVDVCLNPYYLDGVAENCSPLKLYEYLATGKPIVSIAMPETLTLEGLVLNVRIKEEFLRAIEQALQEDWQKMSGLRLTEAKKHSWEKRFQQLEENLAPVLEKIQ
jgi:glycosyltransferase involved in cell wall biosynthesis